MSEANTLDVFSKSPGRRISPQTSQMRVSILSRGGYVELLNRVFWSTNAVYRQRIDKFVGKGNTTKWIFRELIKRTPLNLWFEIAELRSLQSLQRRAGLDKDVFQFPENRRVFVANCVENIVRQLTAARSKLDYCKLVSLTGPQLTKR